MTTNYFKVIAYNSVESVRKTPFTFFPFNDDDLLSVSKAWDAAVSLANHYRTGFYPGARVVAMKRPQLPGSWTQAELIGQGIDGSAIQALIDGDTE